MSRFKKILLLFLALGLPIAVFVFLKMFGKNEFTVQPLFQEAFESSVACKSFSYKAPYVIHDSVLSQIGWIENDTIVVFIFNDGSTKNKHEESVQVDRIFTEVSSKNFRVVYLSEQSSNETENVSENKSATRKELYSLDLYKSCIFLSKESVNAVIVDSKKRIRGQYDLTDLDDSDRLIMEMKIILREY